MWLRRHKATLAAKGSGSRRSRAPPQASDQEGRRSCSPARGPGGQLEGGAGDAPQVCWAPARGQAPQHSDLPLGSGSRSAPWSSALGSLGPSPAVGQLTEGSIMGGGPCVGLRNRRTGRGGTGLPGSRPGPRQTHLHIIRLRALHFSRILNRFLLYG